MEIKNMFSGNWDEARPKVSEKQLSRRLADDCPDWFNYEAGAATHEQKLNVMLGLHPLGATLHKDEELKCEYCRLKYKKRGKYWKCEKAKETAGPGTDLRLKWRACRLFKPERFPGEADLEAGDAIINQENQKGKIVTFDGEGQIRYINAETQKIEKAKPQEVKKIER